jgi:hypothetical protein
MALSLEPYTPAHVPSVLRLNGVLRAGGVDPGFLLPERPAGPGSAIEQLPASGVSKRQFLAVAGAEVRGGFLLQDHLATVGGETLWVGNIQMPISQGLVDRRYVHIAAQMMQGLLRCRPLLFAVGMNGTDSHFAQLLKALRWRVALVPFRFFVFNPGRFLAHIGPLRTTFFRRVATTLARYSGIGPLAIRAAQAARRRPGARPVCTVPAASWGVWADPIWARSRAAFSFGVVRDSSTLPDLLSLDSGVHVVSVAGPGGQPSAWAAWQVTSMRGNRNFGDLRVGTLLDVMAPPGLESAALSAALDAMRVAGADLVVSNHQHAALDRVLAEAGFWSGPSNYVLAMSPALTQKIELTDPALERIYLGRADGDGRIHL